MSNLSIHSASGADELHSSGSHDNTRHSQRDTPFSDLPLDNENMLSDGGSDNESVTTGSAEELDSAMEDILRNYHPRLTKHSTVIFSDKVVRYFPLIRQYGLKQEQFNTLGDIMLNYKLPIGITRKLLRILIPRDSVPEAFIVKIIGLLSNTKSDRVYVNHLLIWAISVFELVDSLTTIRKLYGVMFHYLTYRTTRNTICHLLYYLTRKEDVIPYRVRKLHELVDSEKDTASLIGLLLVYRSFNPEVKVPVNVRLGEMFVFRHPNPQLKTDLTHIRLQKENHEAFPNSRKPYLVLPSTKKLKKARKGREYDEEMNLGLDILRIYDNIQELHYSDQLQAVLDDREIQHLLVCNPDEIAIARLSYWIGHKILYLIRWNNSNDVGKFELKELLEKLLKFTHFAKSQLPVVQAFLREYLRIWNGIDFQDIIFDLITYVNPSDFSDIYQSILLPLYKRYYVHDVTWKSKLILCYTEWLKNWALLDWRGHTRMMKTPTVQGDDIDRITCMFEGLSFDIDYFGMIQKFVEHVDRICVMGLLTENDHPLMQHAALSFFELVAAIPLKHDVPEIIMPAANLVNRCFFASNAMAVSRICGIIKQYKDAYIENEEKSEDWMSRHSSEYLKHFNVYTTDLCNSLWRNMSFSKLSGSGFEVTDEVIKELGELCEKRGEELKMTFSITHSGALAGYSKRFMRELEKEQTALIHHTEPVTLDYLKALGEQGGIKLNYLEYRVAYLNYLNDMGLKGIHDLLYACMTTLIKRRERNNRRGSSFHSNRSQTGSFVSTTAAGSSFDHSQAT